MPKIDLKKEWKNLYTASARTPSLVRVPRLKYLMVDGAGDPGTAPAFMQAMEALYGVSYTLKFTMKLGPRKLDWTVMPPEGIWWAEGGQSVGTAEKQAWRWTLMVAQPSFITAAMVRQAKKTLKEKRNPARLEEVRLEALNEGACVQIMHIGPYAEEQRSVEKLFAFAAENGHTVAGKHHEIYFSDPRRTKPEKLKTIVRYPVKKGR
jgi:hypothetical protein